MLLDDIWRTINVIILICVIFALFIDPASMFLVCMVGGVIGYICKVIAEKKNRDGKWAFLYGFLWGFFALIYYAVCEGTGKLKVK